jgi:hypothetical protein
MKLEYKGYILEIEEIYQEAGRRIVANCDKICYAVNTSEDYDKVITHFRRLVNEHIYLWGETVNTAESCIKLVQKIVNNTPAAVNELFQVLLDFKYRTEEGIGEKDKEECRPIVKFSYGGTTTTLTQNYEGSYVYTSRSNITSPIQFSSINDAILFYSEFLPIDAYDEEDDLLSFEVILEYKNCNIRLYMKDEDRTKVSWIDYFNENKGFNDFQLKNRKINNSVDDILRDFIKWVNTKGSGVTSYEDSND